MIALGITILLIASMCSCFGTEEKSETVKVIDIYPADLIENPYEDGIIIQADIDLAEDKVAEGEGELEIELDGLITYSDKIPLENGVAKVDLKYSEFVFGNGNYRITLMYKGFTKIFPNTYEINWVVERINLLLSSMSNSESKNLTINDDPYFYQTINFNDKEDNLLLETRPMELYLQLYYEDEQSSFDSDEINLENIYKSSIIKKYYYDLAGNITAKLTMTNYNVNSNSYYHTMVATSYELINTPPNAYFELSNGNNNKFYLQEDNGTAEFDASGSFDLDGEIRKYLWDFDDKYSKDNVLVTTEPFALHEFTRVGKYSVVLTVVDEIGLDTMDISGIGIYEFEIEVTRLPV